MHLASTERPSARKLQTRRKARKVERRTEKREGSERGRRTQQVQTLRRGAQAEEQQAEAAQQKQRRRPKSGTSGEPPRYRGCQGQRPTRQASGAATTKSSGRRSQPPGLKRARQQARQRDGCPAIEGRRTTGSKGVRMLLRVTNTPYPENGRMRAQARLRGSAVAERTGASVVIQGQNTGTSTQHKEEGVWPWPSK